MQQQQDIESCELFVITWIVDIAFGNNPEDSMYVKEDMRQYLWWCLQHKNIVPFPKSNFFCLVLASLW